jgi:hypothetical protein
LQQISQVFISPLRCESPQHAQKALQSEGVLIV